MARVTPRRRATAAMSERAALLGRDGDRPSSSRATRDRARARDDAYDVERARGAIDADDGARDAGDRRARRRRRRGASDGAANADARRRGRAACVALGAMAAVLGARARGTGTGDARANANESAALGLTPSRARGVHARSG